MKKTMSLLTLLLFSASTLFAQERMTFEDYQMQLQGAMQDESGLQTQISGVDDEIASTREEIGSTEERTAEVWEQIYALLNTDAEGVADYSASLDELLADANELNRYSAEQLALRQDELDALRQRYEEARANNIGLLSENDSRLDDIEALLNGLQRRLESANIRYTVARGDHLWGIAGHQRHYNDPFMWTRVYTANREKIEDPNLIFPQQVFDIPKVSKSGQYVVQSGDSFFSIAENVYGDSSKWRSIQEANMSLVDQLGGLYPGMIIVLP